MLVSNAARFMIGAAIVLITLLAAVALVACGGSASGSSGANSPKEMDSSMESSQHSQASTEASGYDAGVIPDELECIPDGYRLPASPLVPGTPFSGC